MTLNPKYVVILIDLAIFLNDPVQTVKNNIISTIINTFENHIFIITINYFLLNHVSFDPTTFYVYFLRAGSNMV